MTFKPLVSIITPTFNHEKFIGECIESVLAQTYPNWEQIIIDDRSSDNTIKIINSYTDNRIKLIKNEKNLGIWKLNDIYNKALNASNGELIAILEGDDFWPKHKLEKQIPSFERNEIILSWGKAEIVSDDNIGPIRITPRNMCNYLNRTKDETLKKLLFRNFIPACTVICRKSFLDSIGGFKQPNYMPYVDYPTWLEMCIRGELAPLDEILGYWRHHPLQVSMNLRKDMIKAEKYSILFYNNMPDEFKKSIQLEIGDLLKNYQHKIAAEYMRNGRKALNDKKFYEAKISFKIALKDGSISTKLKSIKGLLITYKKQYRFGKMEK